MKKNLVLAGSTIGILLLLICLNLQPSKNNKTTPSEASATGDHKPAPNLQTAPPNPSTDTLNPAEAVSMPSEIKETQAFREWLHSEHPETSTAIRSMLALRAERMRRLMLEDPEQALDEAVGFAEYQKIPESLREMVERPFADVVTLQALPNCGGSHAHACTHTQDAVKPINYVLMMDGKSYAAGVCGRRLELDTKEDTPLQGIVFENLAAIRDDVVQVLRPEDVNALAGLPLLNPDVDRGYAHRRALGSAGGDFSGRPSLG